MPTKIPSCREPRGLGFIEFTSERACSDAMRGLDRMVLGGREVSAPVTASDPLQDALALVPPYGAI